MSQNRPPYSAEYRQKILELVWQGHEPAELAKTYEPTATTIHNWVAQAQRDAGQRSDGMTSEEREELRRLRRENAQLLEEREILKKAAAWFARETEEPGKPKRSSGSSK